MQPRAVTIAVTCIVSMVSLGFVAATPAHLFTPPIAHASQGSTVPGQLPPRDARPADGINTARITGRVLTTTGTPLRRAQVSISGSGPSKTIVTDDQGRYELSGLLPGQYTVSASKTGYLRLSYQQRRPAELPRPIDVAAGQILERVDFSLPKASAISGRVTDEIGEPVQGASIQLVQFRFSSGYRRPITAPQAQGAQTDDLGQFRVFGLAPGQYYVAAMFRGLLTTALGTRIGYAPIFYPGTPALADAEPVTLGVGQELSSIDIVLVPMKPSQISGVVRSSQGGPLSRIILNLRQKDGNSLPVSTTGVSMQNSVGTFTINNVAPGDYFLDVSVTANGDEFAELPVSVAGGEDISGLTITTLPASSMRGEFVFEGSGRPPTFRAGAIQLLVTPISDGLSIPSYKVSDDWTFQINGLFGPQVFRVSTQSIGWVLKAVSLNGEDITDKSIDLRPNATLTGLQVVLTDRATEVTGVVQDERGSTVEEYVAVVFSEDRERWRLPQSRYIAAARPDQQGHFSVRGLPAGRYWAVALEYIEPGEERDPELLQRLASQGQVFTLGEQDVSAVSLRLLR